MSFTPPNQTIAGRHVGHSSQPSKGSPADGSAVPGRATAHPGKIEPPNNNRFGGAVAPGRSGNPPAATTGDVQGGFIPDTPWSKSGAPNKTIGGKLGADDAAQYRRGR